MEILYVEDEQNKARQVVQVIKENIPSVNILLRNSYNAALMEIGRENLDLILLDMSLPLYDVSEAMEYEEDNDFETFAGIDLLEELVRIDSKKKVIIITAFDVLGEDDNRINLMQLDEKMKKEYCDNYRGIIYYSSSSLEWCHKLVELIKIL
ncbi:MAG: hypothetical protein SOY73_00905 [Blautia sp.]|nr:hypothetical protein [Blautia sp.]